MSFVEFVARVGQHFNGTTDKHAYSAITGTHGGSAHDAVPAARVYNDAATTLTTGVNTVLGFNQERYDTDTMHDTSTNNSRLTATTAGKYHIGACIRFATSTTAWRSVYLRLNGTTEIARVYAEATDVQTQIVVTCDYALSATDYVEVLARQESGGNLDVEVAGNTSPEFWMHRFSA